MDEAMQESTGALVVAIVEDDPRIQQLLLAEIQDEGHNGVITRCRSKSSRGLSKPNGGCESGAETLSNQINENQCSTRTGMGNNP